MTRHILARRSLRARICVGVLSISLATQLRFWRAPWQQWHRYLNKEQFSDVVFVVEGASSDDVQRVWLGGAPSDFWSCPHIVPRMSTVLGRRRAAKVVPRHAYHHTETGLAISQAMQAQTYHRFGCIGTGRQAALKIRRLSVETQTVLQRELPRASARMGL